MLDLSQATALIWLIIIAALLFDYINGFHDTANAIATVVSTRVMSPRDAILMAAVLNFVGALYSTGVAQTVAARFVDPHEITQTVILAAIFGAIVWNLITWYYGIPSSSSHALFGGIGGAAYAHGGTEVILWEGFIEKAIIPIVLSPVMGFLLGFVFMVVIYRLFFNAVPGKVARGFRLAQIGSAALLAYSHGSNDAQKSMGIITMALVSQHILIPADPNHPAIPQIVIVACATAMALGTSAGGWRIMKTMGHKIVRLEPVHGFAAQTTASAVILAADYFHAPISTTQAISGSIFGVGSAKRLSAVKWGVAQDMVVAWFLTLPASAIVSIIAYYLLSAMGLE